MKVFVKAGELGIPKRMTNGAAGYDLRAAHDAVIRVGQHKRIDTDFAIEVPETMVVFICPRSGLSEKGVTVLNSPGVIDSDFRGFIGARLINFGEDVLRIKRGDRIAQMVFVRCATPELVAIAELSKTARGTGGHGSTGMK